MTRRERTIEYIRECRAIHADWIDLLKKGKMTREEIRVGGGVTWHRKWVKRYDAVLRELGADD